MSTQIQWRRGTTAQHNVFTGALGEVTVDTDKDTLVVHDNSTVGGFPLARESALNTHTARTDNPHVVTKAQVGLGNADNTADANKVVASAGKLTTGRTISLSGDATGSVSFDGSANVDVVVTVGNDTHTHAFGNLTGKPTTLAGYGITDADTSTQVTTKINNAVAALVDTSPAALDTLNELAAALGDDPNFATTTATAIGLKADTSYVNTQLALKVDDTEIASVNLLRADKYLAAQNIANMLYTNGDLVKIRYKNDTDIDYEVLNYTSGNLSSINHYTTSVLRGTTTLSYSGGNLVSAIFVGV